MITAIIAAISLVTVLSVIVALAYKGYTIKKNYDGEFLNLNKQVINNQLVDVTTEEALLANIHDIRNTYVSKNSLANDVITKELNADNAQINKAAISSADIHSANMANATMTNATMANATIDNGHIKNVTIDALTTINHTSSTATHDTIIANDSIFETSTINNINSSGLNLSGNVWGKGALNFSSTDSNATTDPYTFQRGVGNRANELILKTSGKFSITDDQMNTKFSIDSKTSGLSLGDAKITQSNNILNFGYLDTQNNLLPTMSVDKSHNFVIGSTANTLQLGPHSYFPNADQHTYIRPGQSNKNILIGDILTSNITIGNSNTNVNLHGDVYANGPLFMQDYPIVLDANYDSGIVYDSATDGIRIVGNKGGTLTSAKGKNAFHWDDNANSYAMGPMNLNKNTLRLAGSNDSNNVIYYDSNIDGPNIHGNKGGKFGNAISWSSNGDVRVGPNSFFPMGSDQNTYIRPGADGKNILIGDSWTKTISLGQATTEIDVVGSLNLNSRPLLFGPSSSATSGISYHDSNNSFGGYAPEGPIIYGNKGGGLGTTSTGPRTALQWDSNAQVQMNNIRFSNKYSGFPDNATDKSEISNDTSGNKQLLIVGNKSGGGARKVGIWDDLDVKGNLTVNNNLTTNGAFTAPSIHSSGAAQIDNTLTVKNGASFNNGYIKTDPAFIAEGANQANSWIYHAPNDNRNTLFIAPGTNGGNWDWSHVTTIDKGGNMGVSGNLTASDIKLSKGWSSYPDNARDRSEISNDVGVFKQLMIVGNKSAGAERRVGIWDRLDVHGNMNVDVSLNANNSVCVGGNCITSADVNNIHAIGKIQSDITGLAGDKTNIANLQNTLNTLSAKVTTLSTADSASITGLQANIATLTAQLKTIQTLQASINPADHATLLDVQTTLAALKTSVTQMNTSITALKSKAGIP